MVTRKAISKKSSVQSPKKPTARLPKLHLVSSNKPTAPDMKVPRRRTQTWMEQQRKAQQASIINEIESLIEGRTSDETISLRRPIGAKELDAIADYIPPAAGPWHVAELAFIGPLYLDDFGGCVGNVLPSVHWWRRIAAQLVEICKYDGIIDAYVRHEQECERMASLLNDVLTAYAAAEAESSSYSCTGGDATLRLLRNYRLYTRDICDLAQGEWPMIDTAPLREFI